MLQITRQGSQWTVDIHGMHAREARFRLDMLLDNAPEELTSTRVKTIRASYNAGQTVIELRKHKGKRPR